MKIRNIVVAGMACAFLFCGVGESYAAKKKIIRWKKNTMGWRYDKNTNTLKEIRLTPRKTR